MTTMRFGLPGGRGELDASSPDSKLVQAAAADELGYDCLWLSEQRPGLASSSPVVLAAAIAASTRRIRIGFSPLLVQHHDPVRLAEEIATLDRLSGGRVNLGIGRADQPAPTLGEALDAVFDRWTAQPILAQDPHPPVFVTADDGRPLKWAAGRGYPVITPAMLPRPALARLLTRFAADGGPVAGSPVERFCLVAETDAAARDIALPLLRQLTDRYARGVSPEPPGLAAGGDLDPERFCAETALVGSPDTVAAKVAELRDDYGVGYVNLRPSLTGLCPLAQQRVTVALVAAEVMPRFRP